MKALTRVLDSYSLMAYLENEDGAEKMIEVIQVARDSGRTLLFSVVNWGEVYYITLREAGRERVEAVTHLISTLPIELVSADVELTKQAAEFKANKRMSYGDCFAAALAKLHKAELVTGDEEFKQVGDEVKILWIQ